MAQKRKIKRRLKKNVRRTMGTLCLVSSLLVASIPVDGSRQAEASVSTSGGETIYSSGLTWEQVNKDTSVIPVISEDCTTIYSTEDGTYQFAFVQKSSTNPDYIAVLLGYNGGNLPNNTLTVPDTVNAYAKFYENNGSQNGYVAVSRSQQALYYISAAPTAVEETTTETVDVTGEDGTVTQQEQEVTTVTGYTLPTLEPCYASESDAWSSLSLDQFYYLDNTATDNVTYEQGMTKTQVTAEAQLSDDIVTDTAGNVYRRTKTSEVQWIKDITVAYIGNQYLTANTDTSTTQDGIRQEWKVASGSVNEDPAKGIFAGESNIWYLEIGENLEGIGNYAFYGCTGLISVSFGNGLTEIGHHAFMNCNNMTSIGLDSSSKISYISDYCFANCANLQSFDMPYNVQAIYDHAFDGCSSLASVNLTGTASHSGMALTRLGYSVFKNCTSLEELTFPGSFTGTYALNLNNFENCSALKHITFLNSNAKPEGAVEGDADADATTTYTVDDFKNDVHSTFYFEAATTSATHTFTQENAIAFKYSDQDLYEILMKEIGTDGETEETLTYQVNSLNELVYFGMTGNVAEVTIPSAIGPYGISAINSGSFSNNCFLTKITIPATVTTINEDAFKGCHNLKHVIFENAAAITYIGDGAFATQVVTLHQTGCDGNLDSTPSLSFTGTVGSSIVPFTYAMNGDHNINTGSQPLTYITYYSGWPTNLTIQYVTDDDNAASDHTGKATLVDYPTYSELTSVFGVSSSVDTYPYMTEDYAAAARDAVEDYTDYLSDSSVVLTQEEWNIINAALNPVIPSGVKAVKEGLFNGADSVTEDGDGGYDVNRTDGTADTNIKTLTFEDLDEYTPYMFDGCDSLTSVSITGGTAQIDDYAFARKEDFVGSYQGLTSFYMAVDSGSSIGDHAFDNNPGLTAVTISSTVDSLGIRPFSGCTGLKTGSVSFSGGPYYEESDGIIYELTDGVRTAIVQCLESKSGSVKVTDSTITSMYDEAFMDCSKVGKVDLSGTSLTKISKDAFNNTSSIYSVSLPASTVSIGNTAFHDSSLQLLEDIPDSLAVIADNAFDTASNLPSSGLESDLKTIEFECSEDAIAARAYADLYENIIAVTVPSTVTWSVRFIAQDEDGNIYDFYEEQIVLDGEKARTPELTPELSGYTFSGWYTTPDGTSIDEYDLTEIHQDLTFQARFTTADAVLTTVRFLDLETGEELAAQQTVTPGSYVVTPESPTKEGYTFTGWTPSLSDPVPEKSDGSTYDIYAIWSANTAETTTVRFLDLDTREELCARQTVTVGSYAVEPNAPTKDGYTFSGWSPSLDDPIPAVTEGSYYDVYAVWTANTDTTKTVVRFLDLETREELANRQTVTVGDYAVEPVSPTKDGYTFSGWSPSLDDPIPEVTAGSYYDVYAIWTVNSSSNSSGTDDNSSNNSSTNTSGDNNSSSNSNSSGTSTSGDNNSDISSVSDNDSTTFYTLTVKNGMGSGSYAEGAQAIIIANDPASGQEFSYWSVDSGSVTLPSTAVSATVVTMPASNVTVTAHYKTSTSSSSATSTGSGSTVSSGNSGSKKTTNTVSNTGTTVVIDKNGLSNTGVVSATVNGSSDNFTVKVSESSSATQSAVTALMAEFGTDLTNIKYFPMDISLYDSTGSTLITDTTGLSVSITLPIPDSLITYAGNNKIASVSNNQLEKLSAKFTTIDGVACMTFTAEHFSPYVIYVDTANLTASTISDNTPKTGDGIHPKWFLSMGLACLSVVLFLKKDKKQTLRKVKA